MSRNNNNQHIPTVGLRLFCALLICAVHLSCASGLSLKTKIGTDVAEIAQYQRKNALTRTMNVQIPFVENHGQVEEKDVRYYAQTFGGSLFVKNDGEMVYVFPYNRQEEENKVLVLREKLISDTVSCPIGLGRSEAKLNYFLGNERSRWKTNVPAFNTVSFGEVYMGVELILKAQGRRTEKVFSVYPAADPSTIRISLEGAQRLSINPKGELEATTDAGVVRFSKPIAYQEDGLTGVRQSIQVAYALNDNEYGFNVGEYDTNRPLIIDPFVSTSIIGGADNDYSRALATDAAGNVYIVGYSWSGSFPGATDVIYGPGGGGTDVFVAKIDPFDGTLEACAFLGSPSVDDGYAIALLDDGTATTVYVCGRTSSWLGTDPFTEFPGATATSVYGTTSWATTDAFVSRLSADLGTLEGSSILRGSNQDIAQAITVNPINGGQIYVAGYTASNDLPLGPATFRNDNSYAGGNDGFISYLNNALDLQNSTFLGETGAEDIKGITFSPVDDYVYVTGITSSSHTTGFPRSTPSSPPSGFDGVYRDGTPGSDYDGFIARITPHLTILVDWTYFGGNANDYPSSITLDAYENVYIGGSTSSDNVLDGFPITVGVIDGLFQTSEGFIAKLSSNLDTLISSTYLGGSSNDDVTSIAVNAVGGLAVGGWTASGDFPVTADAVDSSYEASGSGFVSIVNKDLTILGYSTFLGTDSVEQLNGIAAMGVDIFATGYTTHWENFPGLERTFGAPADYSAPPDPSIASGFLSLLRLSADMDEDGLNYVEERLLDTDPLNPDSDGDGVNDLNDAFPMDPNDWDDSDAVETQISPTSSQQSYLSVFDNLVVWQDNRNGNWDIYLYDLFTQTETRITTDLSDQKNPCISGDIIVWEDYRNGDAVIYMYDLSSPTLNGTRITADTSDELNPAVSGGRIVWERDPNTANHDIYMYSISTGRVTQITTDTSIQANPSISGDYIVWEDYRNGTDYDIFMWNLSNDTEIQITNSSGHQLKPVVSGQNIVWEDQSSFPYQVVRYNISAMTVDSFAEGQSPAISGDFIVYQRYQSGSWNIYQYNIADSTEKQISANLSSVEEYAAIFKNTVVWESWNYPADLTATRDNAQVFVYAPDGIGDNSDNCPDTFNPDQADADNNGIGDACDATAVDSDGDGLSDNDELTVYYTDPGNPDTDADGLWDGAEVIDYLTDPLDPDSDADLISDGYEIQMGTDPNSATSTPPIPITGVLHRATEPDSSVKTYIEVMINDGFVGTLPGDISNIIVRRPDGLALPTPSPSAWIYYPQWRDFFVSLDGEPPLKGVYTFEVQSGSLTGTDTDHQYINRNLPIPDATTFSATITSKTPTFSWSLVDYPENIPLYYRLEIEEPGAGIEDLRVFATGRIKDLSSYTLPVDVLKPGTDYRWRIRLIDNGRWEDVQNRSSSNWVYLTTPGPGTFDDHSSIPAIDLDGWGVLSWTRDVYGTGTECWVRIYDHDGISSDGSSHSVTVQLQGDSTVYPMDFVRSYGPNSAGYELWDGNPPPAGTYIITVTDPDGNTASLTETLSPADINPLDPPDPNTITPNLLSEHITASFDNVYVNGNPTVFENFDGYNTINDIDWSKWEWYQNAAIQKDDENGLLVLDIGNSVGRTSGQLSFADKSSINAIKADITITNTTTETPRAEIGGTWCHNGVGDVGGRIRVTSNSVYYSVWQEYFNEQDTYHWDIPLSSGTLLNGAFDSVPVTVEIIWDEQSSTLTFIAENGFDSNTATYVVTGNVGPPINQYKDLRARINLVTDTTPTFTWAPVAFTNSNPQNPTYANRYRLRIYNGGVDNQREIWRGTFGEQTDYTVPPGVLKPGSYYRFRVEALDSHSPLNLNNLSKTPPSNDDNFIFYTNDQEAVDPFIELDNSGVRTWNDPVNGAFLHFRIKVHDAQGVPDNISSVTVEHPNGSVTTLNPSCSDSFSPSTPTSCIYSKSSFQPIEGGDYIFTVVDLEGHINTVTETLTPGVLDLPVLLSPASGLPIGDTAVDFNWSDVTDAKFYSVDIFDWDYNLVYTFHTEQSNFYLAAGFLKSQTLYRWRVKARREYITENLDNNSSSSGFWTMSTFATIPPADLDQDGIPDYWEELHGLDPAVDDADLDSDGDGLTNIQEFENATDPQSLDTDGDSLWDGDEILFGTRPRSMDTDDDGVNDFDDQFPTDITEWADYDTDGIGDNSDNCPYIRNPISSGWTDIFGVVQTDAQPDYDQDGQGNACDHDADNDGFLSPYTANGDDCNDLNENIYPVWDVTDERYECNDEPIDGLAPKIKPPPVEEDPPTDGDTIDAAIDNCPNVANQDQDNLDGDALGDACDNCDDFPNDNQVLPWWYKDADLDGYTSGDRLQQCDSPAPGLYKREDDQALLSTLVFDCNDDDETFFPFAADLAKDCDPNTQSPADAQPYNIVIENITLTRGTTQPSNMAYGIWDPQAGDQLTVAFKVTGQPDDVTTTLNSRDEKLNGAIQYTDVLMTHYEGNFLNDDSELGVPTPQDDFSALDLSVANQATFTIYDYGGVITFKAKATVITNASTASPGTIPIEKVFSFPKDLDEDKVPDFYETQYPGDLLPGDDLDNDGLTVLQEYRGPQWGRLVRQEAGGAYNTAAYLPETLPNGAVTHVRTNPTLRTLFVQFSGFDVQFAIGEAFHTLADPVEVFALGDTVVVNNGVKDYRIDVASVTYKSANYGAENGHIIDRSDRDWIFSTLGSSSFGDEVDYGASCYIYRPAMEAFFSGDLPYQNGSTFIGTTDKQKKDQAYWTTAANTKLDPVGLVEDGNDNGNLDTRENLVDLPDQPAGQLDGDHPVPCVEPNCDPDLNNDGWPDNPWEYDHDLSPFDIDGNGLVELPVVAEPIDVGNQFSIAQGVKHVATHELGHNVGVTQHTTDSTCVMYEYTNDLLRDGHFSPSAAEKIRIHNQ